MTHLRTLCLLVLLGALAAPAAAGEIYIPDNQPTVGTCNVFPWGTSSEWRFQSIVPANLMGGKPVVISEISYSPCTTGTFSSPKCEIRMAHLTKASTTNFQSNLEKDLTVVFSGVTSSMTGGLSVTFGEPFTMSCTGSSDIGIDVSQSGSHNFSLDATDADRPVLTVTGP